MTLFDYYIQYLTQICEGGLTVPGLQTAAETPEARAMELQAQIAALGIPGFVRRCAETAGDEIPEAVYADFSEADLAAALQGLVSAAQADGAEAEAPEETPKQNAYEAFLDCLCLEDALLDYLRDVLLRKDGLEFFRLSQVTVRQELKLEDFLYWFGTKELYADETERGCVTVIDALVDRLAAEGQKEAVAALLSGDRTTYELIRSEAPELRQAPAATYEWFENCYLDRYYPIRAILRLRGVEFPTVNLEQ